VKPGRSIAAISAKHKNSILRFAAYCARHRLKLAWDENDELGQGHIVDLDIRDFKILVTFCAFERGTPAAKMKKELLPFQLGFGYFNEDAGLAMSDLGLRGNPDIPPDADKRATPAWARLVKMFREYHPDVPTTQGAHGAAK
jgi:hypothetical protein